MDLQRTCGWCGTHVSDASLTNCRNCGGPLPALPADDGRLELGQPPPAAPRRLPDTYRRRVLFSKNVFVILGVVFTFCLGWTIVFALVGAPLLYVGWTRAQKKLRALTDGHRSGGRIVEVERDGTVQINNRSPWKIVYTYEAAGKEREGWVHAWDRPRLRPDDAVWVVWGPDDPADSCLWPPVK